ncbi:hypothetical protein [Pseudomonas sp. NPDC089734]|uniref:hypothetical protein n=1 Tax=Pseudomonas sp. NPDC089734 TaxID=3364469 RepID=UPI0037F31950
MPRSIHGDLPQIVVRTPPVKTSRNKKSPQLREILREAGSTNSGALNMLAMEKKKMKPLFRGFNPELITPKQLSRAGMKLYSGGFIDNHTAELLSRAGDEFDEKGEVRNPDKAINALEFFAGRVAAMKKKALLGDPYSKMLLPDYIKVIHVIQNLHTFASTGTSAEMMKINEAEKKSKAAANAKSVQ